VVATEIYVTTEFDFCICRYNGKRFNTGFNLNFLEIGLRSGAVINVSYSNAV
jgi:hypothetical protein